ncbi:LysE family translocator [Paludibacterium paludis]|uniref:Membrane protein n=1 Tax=Paludibacterium paludis TaxID=1225769 RepID=A0A918P1W3_9NEIS|nr:LysE family translocator [Paludibacterium paludis]GGY13168.1 membrane protein [Paludibacterium paludis]
MIPAPDHLAAFMAAALVITLSPGPDNLMVLSLGIARGRREGMMFGLGCALGCLNHTLLAALGISALIAASPVAFTLLKFAGGVYLVHMGWQAIRSSGSAFRANAPNEAERVSSWSYFRRGLIANAINPKVVLFFLAFLPQFVDTSLGHAGWQIALYGTLFTLQGALLFGALGYFAGHIGRWMSRSPSASKWLDRMAGGVFIALGVRLLFAPTR